MINVKRPRLTIRILFSGRIENGSFGVLKVEILSCCWQQKLIFFFFGSED